VTLISQIGEFRSPKFLFSSQIERVLTACKEFDILDLKSADGKEVQNTEAAYEEILHKIRIMKAVPPEIKMALQTQNTSAFLEALKKLPNEEAIQVVDDCVASGILKMEASSNPLFHSFFFFFCIFLLFPPD